MRLEGDPMKVPFADLRALHVPLTAELRTVFERVVENNSFILGPEVKRFEELFAAYIGTAECIAVNSGTAALHLVLLALGIGPGDEVITVANTFIATAEAITAVGATPVFVDVDPCSYNMDPTLVEQAITPRTRAILPVHLFGQSAEMDALHSVAQRHNLLVIEDACQAHGAEYRGRKAGSMGVAGCFSFYPGKNLGALGEGGAVVTNDREVARKVRMLRDHGSAVKYQHEYAGFNFRMEGLQGGFLAAKLPHLESANEKRRSAAALYNKLLAGSSVITPEEKPGVKHVYHLYVIQTERRDALKQKLNENAVETGFHYPIPLHLQKAYAGLDYRRGDLPVTEQLADRILSLPMYPDIRPEQVEFVCQIIQETAACLRAESAAAN
jgi:dTDP-4-amino-4,6-dideoxygalactose transaminase